MVNMNYKIFVAVQGMPNYYCMTDSFDTAEYTAKDIAGLGERVKVENTVTGENHYYPDRESYLTSIGYMNVAK